MLHLHVLCLLSPDGKPQMANAQMVMDIDWLGQFSRVIIERIIQLVPTCLHHRKGPSACMCLAFFLLPYLLSFQVAYTPSHVGHPNRSVCSRKLHSAHVDDENGGEDRLVSIFVAAPDTGDTKNVGKECARDLIRARSHHVP